MIAIAADALLFPAAAVDLDTIAADSLIAADAAVGLPDVVVDPVALPDAAARCCARCATAETSKRRFEQQQAR